VHRQLHRRVRWHVGQLPQADRARAHRQVLDRRGLLLVGLDPLFDELFVLARLLTVLLE
jgi:hypothetical protein